jgi:hypothetical protein
MAKEWRYAQEKYLTRTKSFRFTRRWLSALIRKMWQIAWDLWEHRNGYLHNKGDNLISQEVNRRLEHKFAKRTKLLRHSKIRYFTFIRGRIGRLVTAWPDPGDVKALRKVVDNLLLIHEYLFIYLHSPLSLGIITFIVFEKNPS